MIPKLYGKDMSILKFYGYLVDCTRAVVIEERNGMFELELDYQLQSEYSEYLVRGHIIEVDANDNLKGQYFRIYKVTKDIIGHFTVYAQHISYDISRDYTDGMEIENQSCEYCLNQLFTTSQFSQKFIGHSDIINAQNYKMGNNNLLSAIAGSRGSIIDTFGTGAEILRDNYDFYVLNRRGNDNGVVIEYASNLTGLDYEEDATNLITRIRAVARYTPEVETEEGAEEQVIYTYVDSPNIALYETPFISEIDFTDKFGEGVVPTVEELTQYAEKYFEDNKCDLVDFNYKISFIPLSKCVGYEDIEDKIELCDTVTIIDSRYGLNTQAKVIRTEYDVLRERYNSMELGEPKSSLGDIIGNNDSTKGEKGDKGDKGDKGEDGSIGDFPNSLPSTPTVTTKVYGFANIEISWTFENKVYYQYEVYASKEADFTPNTFNLIHSGQTSTYMYQAKPDETWYFKVCAINSHGERTSFGSAYATTAKIGDLSNYVDNMAIGDALIGTLSLDRGWYGELKGNYIDAKQLSVTDGNGVRTLDIDSYGNVNLNVASLKISSSNVATESYANTKASTAQTNAINSAENTLNSTIANYYTKTQTDSKISVLNDSINLKASKTEVTEALDKLETSSINLFRYSNFERENILNHWDCYTTTNHTLQIGTYTEFGKNLISDRHIKNKKILRSRINIAQAITDGVTYGGFNLLTSKRNIVLEPNSEYTFSYWVYLGGSCKSTHASIWTLPQDSSTSSVIVGRTTSVDTYTGSFVRQSVTFTTNDETNYYIRFYHYFKTDLTEGESDVNIYQPLLTKGNKVVDWSESPLDIEEFTGEYIDNQIKDTKAEIKITTDSISQNISNLTNTVSTKADNTTVTNLSNKVTTIETNVNSVTTRVSNTEEEIDKTNEKALKNYNNLLVNSNIKNGIQGWRLSNLESNKSLYQGTTTSVLPPDRHTIIIGDNDDNTVQTRFMDSTKFVVQAGEKISISYYIMANTYVNYGRVYILFTDNTKPIEEDNTFMTGNTYTGISGYTDWTKKTETVTVPTGATRAFIRIRYQSLEKPSASDTNRIALASLMVSRGEDYPTWTSNAEDSYYAHEERLSYAESKITDSAITNVVKQNFYTKTETENAISEKGYQTSSQVQQTVDKLELKFQQSGGYNLLYNGNFKRGTDKWSITSGFTTAIGNGNYSSPDRRGIRITGQSGTAGYIYQNISSEYYNSYNYTLSGNVYISSSGTDDSTDVVFHYYVRLSYNDGTCTYHRSEWDKTKYDKWQFVSLSFNRDTSKTLTEIRVALSIQNSTRNIYLSQAMLETGETSTGWSPNPNELTDGVTTIDKDGIVVENSSANTTTSMKASGFYINQSGSGDVFKVDSEGISLNQGNVSINKDGMKIQSPTGDILTQTSNNGFYITKGGTNVFYANANGVSLANGIVSMNANGITVKSSDDSTQTFMNDNGFYIKNEDSYVFSVDDNGIALSQGNVSINKDGMKIQSPTGGILTQTSANGFYIKKDDTSVFYANTNGVSLANGNVSMNANGVTVKSPDVSTQTFMNANGFNIKNGDSYVFSVDDNGIALSQGVTTINKTGVKVTHSNGDYSQMTASGFMRYVDGSGKSYHYLMSSGTVNVKDGQTATVTLPSEFKGKNFKVTVSAFKINIISGWEGVYDMDSFVSATDKANGTFTIKGMVNDVNGLEGTLDVSYIVIA